VVLYRSPNDITLFLVPLQAVALAIALFGDEARERRLAIPFLAITFLADVASLSRGGWLAMVVVVLVVGLFSTRRLLIAAGAAVVVAAALAIPGSRRRILVQFDPNSADNSVQLRFVLWRSALNMLRHNPIFGGGLSGFQQAVRPYSDPNYHEQLIDLLVGSRLVTSDAGVVEIAHEALARAWPRLRAWLDDDLEGQRILHHLTTAAATWDAMGRPDSELYRGVRLAQAFEQLADQKFPPPVIKLLRRTLANDSAERPQSARALLEALQLCAAETKAAPRRRRAGPG